MEKISVFKNFTREVAVRTLSEIVQGVRGTHYKEAVFKIREAVERGDKEEADKLKKKLLAFTVSGEFSGGRKMEFLKKYNPFVILDIDNLEKDAVSPLLDKINALENTRASFISPSGRGVKVIIEVNSEQEDHLWAYNAVVTFYEEELGIDIDKSGKDITRLCFMSHDPSAYFNPESEVCGVKYDPDDPPEFLCDGIVFKKDIVGIFKKCKKKTNETLKFEEGNRNNYIYKLAVNLSNEGVPEMLAFVLCKMVCLNTSLSEGEIESTVRSAYNWRPTIVQKKSKTIERTLTELPTDTPPPIPLNVFSNLPGFLSRGCAAFKDERERDVFLTGAIGVLSGCMPNVSGNYDGNVCYPNLYVFVIAPAASGKGALKFAKMLGMGYHEQLLEENRKAQKEYKRAFLEFELSSAKFKKGKLSELPKEPEGVVFKTLFIPANSSSAMLVRHLHHNNDSGVLFESEADTLGNVLKQDWGGYSDLMRKAYHHEAVSYSRKQNNEFLEIRHPKLSVALSGTPGQVTGLIPSAEDGLFSRFLFYAFEVEANWRDVSPEGRSENFQSFFEELSVDVIGMVTFLKKNPMKFSLKKEQWKVLNELFRRVMKETSLLVGKDAVSLVKRSGLMLFRIAMIFSAIRKYEEQNTSKSIICEDDDFNAALLLVETYLENAFFLFDRLPKWGKSSFQFKNVRQQLLYDKLPMKFLKREAIKIGADLKIPKRTVGRYLHLLVKSGYLVQSEGEGFGMYEKRGEG
jgi:hypothetical protein